MNPKQQSAYLPTLHLMLGIFSWEKMLEAVVMALASLCLGAKKLSKNRVDLSTVQLHAPKSE